MKASELRMKLEKAEEKLAKALSTIEKRNVKIQNMKEKLEKLGYSTDPDCRFEGYSEESMMNSEYGRLIEDNVWGSKKLPELERIVEGWKSKLEKAIIAEARFDEMPEALKTMEAHLIQNWFEYGIERKARMNEDRKTLNDVSMGMKYGRNYFDEMYKDDEQIKKEAERDARFWVLDLASRVENAVGNITDWKRVHFSGKALNGLVVGTNGTAVVETIEAGGYNIQKLHYRVLVKMVKA